MWSVNDVWCDSDEFCKSLLSFWWWWWWCVKSVCVTRHSKKDVKYCLKWCLKCTCVSPKHKGIDNVLFWLWTQWHPNLSWGGTQHLCVLEGMKSVRVVGRVCVWSLTVAPGKRILRESVTWQFGHAWHRSRLVFFLKQAVMNAEDDWYFSVIDQGLGSVLCMSYMVLYWRYQKKCGK